MYALYSIKQERISIHRVANFTLRLILEGLERSTIRDKSTKVSHAQETRLFDLSKDLVNLVTFTTCITCMSCMN